MFIFLSGINSIPSDKEIRYRQRPSSTKSVSGYEMTIMHFFWEKEPQKYRETETKFIMFGKILVEQAGQAKTEGDSAD